MGGDRWQKSKVRPPSPTPESLSSQHKYLSKVWRHFMSLQNFAITEQILHPLQAIVMVATFYTAVDFAAALDNQ